MFESLFRKVESPMRKPLDLNDARTFVATAQAGSLSGAARDLEVPTSTVSRSLTRLEGHVGLMLVRRSPHGLVLTDAGKDYLLSCKQALRLLREGDDLLEKHRAEPAGLLTVECPVTMEMILPGGKVIAPTGKAFDLDFATTAKWDGDLLIEEFALWDSAMQAQQIGLA